MLTNADCTVFENGGTVTNYNITAAHQFSGVYWTDARGRTVSTGGVQISDSILVYIYGDPTYTPKAGDVIVKGLSDFTPTSGSVKELKAALGDTAVITSVNDARYGGLPHIEITAR